MSLILRARSEKGNPNRIRLTSPLFDPAENIGDSFAARLCAEVAVAVDAGANGALPCCDFRSQKWCGLSSAWRAEFCR
jgi:hypothetical protein